MENSSRIILVTGATGRQGGAAARHLLEKGWRVRAFTRDPQSAAANALRGLGAEVVQGDYEDAASLKAALQGAYGVFSMQASRDEVRQGKQIADEAKAAVQHFVYASVQSADSLARVNGDGNKWEIEQYIASLGLPATILRPSFFMDTLAVGPLYGVPNDTFSIPMNEDAQLGLIAAENIGAFAALAFEHPETYVGKTVELAGDALTPPQIADAISRATGRSIHYVQLPIEAAYAQDPKMAHAVEYLNEVGYPVDIADLRTQYPDLMDFEAWLEKYGKRIFAATHLTALDA